MEDARAALRGGASIHWASAWWPLKLALYRVGRQADGLQSYQKSGWSPTTTPRSSSTSGGPTPAGCPPGAEGVAVRRAWCGPRRCHTRWAESDVMRTIAAPFVVAPPSGARIRTRLAPNGEDERVLMAVGRHLGSLAGRDLAGRCRLGRGGAGRAGRKRDLTPECSSRWAGAITRTSADQWAREWKNLADQRNGLRRGIRAIEARLAIPVGARAGRVRGYASGAERFSKQRRRLVLRDRLKVVEDRIAGGRVSIVRGGRRLATTRHHLAEAGLAQGQWQARWVAERMFICADGEADKVWGNETIRVHPEAGWIEIKLPRPLAHLANRPHGRYRLGAVVEFSYRGDEWAAQAATGAVRYDITLDPDRGRWYLDASWTSAPEAPALDELRRHPTLGVDLNADHLACWVVDPAGNPVGSPKVVPLHLAGLSSGTRDGHLRDAIVAVLRVARMSGCRSVSIENLGFTEARAAGRETMGRGRRGKRFRRVVAGIPTAKFRARLVGMAHNQGLAVIAVDPAYTSKWGGQHWQAPLNQQTRSSTTVTRHLAAAVVIGRRSHGHRGRRRPGVTDPHQRMRPGELPARPTTHPAAVRNPEPPQAHGQTTRRPKTHPADKDPTGNQATQDRSGPPVSRDTLLLTQ